MNRVKKFLRLLGLIVIILLATMGIGAPISFNTRETYLDHEVRTEQAENKDDESENEQEDELNG